MCLNSISLGLQKVYPDLNKATFHSILYLFAEYLQIFSSYLSVSCQWQDNLNFKMVEEMSPAAYFGVNCF